MIRKCFLLLLLSLPLFVTATGRVDSLRQVVQSTTDEQQKMEAIFALVEHYQMWSHDSTKILSEQGLALAEKLEDYRMITLIYLRLGLWYHNKGQFEEAKNQYFRALSLIKEHQIDEELPTVYTNLGLTYRRGFQQDSAFYYFSQAEKLFLQQGEPYDIWYVYSGLAQMFADLGETDKAERYFLKAYETVQKGDSRMDQGFLLYMINLFYFTHERFDQFADFRKKWEAFQQERKTSKEMMEIPEHVGMYLFDSDDEENFTARLNRAIEHYGKINNKFLAGWCYEDLGDYYRSKEDYSAAIAAYDSAQMSYQGIGSAYRRGRAFYQLYEINKLTGDATAALEYLEQYKTIADSLRSAETEENLNQLQVQYETEKKENALVIKELELNQKTQERNVLLGSSILLALLAIAIFLGFRQRIETNKKLNDQAAQIQDQRIRQLEQEKKLGTLNAMLEGQENERIRIAQDLHDGLGGLLTTVKAHFGAIRGKSDEGQSEGLYQKTNNLIDEACVEVRRISQNMMPRALMLSGLIGATEDLAGQIRQQGIDCQLDIIGLVKEPPKKVSIMLFRILQELINNVLKHAGAQNILIQLIQHNEELTLIVEDDGKGFDVQAARQQKSVGMTSIESRVRFLRGNLDMDSIPGEGTTVTVHIPEQE